MQRVIFKAVYSQLAEEVGFRVFSRIHCAQDVLTQRGACQTCGYESCDSYCYRVSR